MVGGDSLLWGLLDATTSARLQILGFTVLSLVVVEEEGASVDEVLALLVVVVAGRRGMGAHAGGEPDRVGLVSLW